MQPTFTTLDNFGHSLTAQSFVVRARNVDQIHETFQRAKKEGRTVTARGAGRSYNDASMNGGGLVLDLTGMNRILEWQPANGAIRCEPGVTIRQLWEYVLPEGWWPPVVPGTMRPTLGGVLSTNIHGKNNFRAGPIGEHVLEFSALLPNGKEVTCSPKKNSEIFYAMIGGLGMLGIFTSITLQMKRIESGLVEVRAWPTSSLREQIESIKENAPHNDYIVGWFDTLGLQRGQVHAANMLAASADPHSREYLQVEKQNLPERFFGVMPKSALHYFMRPFFSNNAGMRLVNTAKFISALRRHSYKQAHAAYQFYLDYVPDWERSFGAGGLIQYQSFLPADNAHQVWTELLARAKRLGLPPYLGVTKRHRPDKFLLTHGVDGFSLALDFKVRRPLELSHLLQTFDKIVAQAGGRFYFAKNSETTSETALRFYGKQTVDKFMKLKERCDPQGLLESDLFRRIFGDRNT